MSKQTLPGLVAVQNFSEKVNLLTTMTATMHNIKTIGEIKILRINLHNHQKDVREHLSEISRNLDIDTNVFLTQVQDIFDNVFLQLKMTEEQIGQELKFQKKLFEAHILSKKLKDEIILMNSQVFSVFLEERNLFKANLHEDKIDSTDLTEKYEALSKHQSLIESLNEILYRSQSIVSLFDQLKVEKKSQIEFTKQQFNSQVRSIIRLLPDINEERSRTIMAGLRMESAGPLARRDRRAQP